VKVEKHDQGDADPDVENEINAAADTGPQGDVRGVIGDPGEIEAGNRDDYRKHCHSGRTTTFIASVDRHANQQEREDDLRDHR